ncbi:MAG TPA: hypothetical protein VHP36_00075 [Chitinispirillaceae bacterium]|nr:hypothetical protein [Chitinispirillaceae bacterium]
MKRLLLIAILVVVSSDAQDNVRFIYDNGFGARAFSMANNYVALSNDLSAVYWNPAALSFSLAREFQVSFDVSSLNGDSYFSTDQQSSRMNRLKISNAGLMYSFPATQGGLTIAFAYSNPVVFDDISKINVAFKIYPTDVDLDKSFRTSGGLKYLSGGLGIQVAPKIGIGATMSFVYGREDMESTVHWIESQGNLFFDSTEVYGIKGKYTGYDLRLGAFYKDRLVSAGLRFTFPQFARVTEDDNDKTRISDSYNKPLEYEISEKYRAKMYSSYSGAGGISLTLPFLTISAEGRAVFPFSFVFPSEEIPKSSQAGYFKVGGGLGMEFPVPKMPVLVRAGYSIDEIDLHRFVFKYGKNKIAWGDDDFNIDKNRHQISAGVVFFSSSMSLDISYGYSMWEISKNFKYGYNYDGNIKQDYSLHKIMTSLAIRF